MKTQTIKVLDRLLDGFIGTVTGWMTVMTGVSFFTCILETPQHIVTKDIVGCNGIIILGRDIETRERIRLNQIEFLLAIFDSTIPVSISCNINGALSPCTATSQCEHQEHGYSEP